jgi:hypothetical protein
MRVKRNYSSCSSNPLVPAQGSAKFPTTLAVGSHTAADLNGARPRYLAAVENVARYGRTSPDPREAAAALRILARPTAAPTQLWPPEPGGLL